MKNIQEIFAHLETSGVQRKTFAQLDQKYKYAQLTKDVRILTSFFADRNIRAGARLIISSGNKYGVALLFWACLRNGMTAVLLDPEMGASRAGELIDLCQPAHLFIDEKCRANWSLPEDETRVTVIGERARRKGSLLKKLLKNTASEESDSGNLWSVLEKHPVARDLPSEVPPESIAYILFTSGSTATPKAVQISHQALWSNLATVSKVYELDETSRILNILTVYHTDGIIQGPVLSGFLAASWYSPLTFSVNNISAIFDAVYTYEISHFLVVPTLLHFLNQFREGFEDTFNTDSFKHIICSAAPLETAFWNEFEANFGLELVNVYGLTETIAGASYCSSVTNSRKVGSIGVPIDCLFSIVDTNDEAVGDGIEGELLIKGDNVLTAYLDNDAANAEAFQNGWFRTGDLAIRDDDGIYWISGRKKNLVITGGINIQPEEVMAILNTHPGVKESACVGVEDTVFGEILVAAVVLREGAVVDEGALGSFCREELEEAKIPKVFHFVSELPKTGSGKVKYTEVRQRLLEKSSGSEGNLRSGNDLRHQLKEIAAQSFKYPAENIDFSAASTTTIDGWDSLAHLTFVTSLEDAFNIHFNAKEIMSVANLLDAERIVRSKVKK